MMIVSTTLQRPDAPDFPAELKIAQEAIYRPDVQDMLRKLAEYNLGIFMPHMHGESGRFEVLPAGMVQVEEDLEVTFQSAQELTERNERYLGIGWTWDASNPNEPKLACRLACVTQGTDTQHYSSHTSE
jgi:hypothetical protein